MTTSGTYSFTVTRDDVIKSSLRVLGVIGSGDTPTSDEYTNASQALNIMIKAWMTDGMDLWTIQDVSFATTAAKATYTFGPTGDTYTTFRPLRIVDAHIRDSSGHDTSLMMLSRQEYELLSDKTTQGIPNQFFYDPQIPNGTLYLYNVPADATHTILLTVQRPLQDMSASTDNFDFPQEWFQALKWGLAAELALEYSVPLQVVQVIEGKAAMFKENMVSWSQEEAATFFTPTVRFRR